MPEFNRSVIPDFRAFERHELDKVPPPGELHMSSEDLFTYLKTPQCLKPAEKTTLRIKKPYSPKAAALVDHRTAGFNVKSKLGHVGLSRAEIVGTDEQSIYVEFENRGDYNLMFPANAFIYIGNLYAEGVPLYGVELRNAEDMFIAKNKSYWHDKSGQRAGWDIPIERLYGRWDQIGDDFDIRSIYSNPSNNLELNVAELPSARARSKLHGAIKITYQDQLPSRSWRRPTEVVATLPVYLKKGLMLMVRSTGSYTHGESVAFKGGETEHSMIGEIEDDIESTKPLPTSLRTQAFNHVSV
jgi:hypothetical protein